MRGYGVSQSRDLRALQVAVCMTPKSRAMFTISFSGAAMQTPWLDILLGSLEKFLYPGTEIHY